MSSLSDRSPMRLILFLSSFCFIPWAFAQGNDVSTQSWIEDLSKIRLRLSEQAIEEHLSSNGEKPLPSAFLLPLLPDVVQHDTTNTCPSDEQPADESRYELLAVMEMNNQNSTVNNLTLPFFTQVQESFVDKLFDYGKNFTDEDALANFISYNIGIGYQTRQGKLQILSAISSRFNDNYNSARNPGANNSTFNPENKALPTGDISLNDLVRASVAGDPFQGGVCNDISEAVAIIGKKLFPNEDVLVINSGAHFGVLISDGADKVDLINYSKQYSLEKDLMLEDDKNSTNFRLHKVENGILKEIAVVDTQAGMAIEDALSTDKKTVNIAESPNRLIYKFNQFIDQKERHQFSLAGGAVTLNQQKEMYIIAAKYEYNNSRFNGYFGLAGSGTRYPDNATPFQVHLRSGADLRLVKYASPKLQINLGSGFRLDGMYSQDTNKNQQFDWQGNPLVQPVDASGSLDLVQQAGVQVEPNSGTQISVKAEVVSTAGLSNVGAANGAFANGIDSGIKGLLENSGLHLNQVNASFEMRQRLTSTLEGVSQVNYQGTNIGQVVSARTGLDIKGPDGAQIMVFVGAVNNNLPGFETKNNFLVGPNGTLLGAGFKTNDGVEVNASVNNINQPGGAEYRGTISVPLSPARRDRRRR
jgi:hypothetical protein